MKKLIALAALAACLPTFAGTVESSNTVGYTKVRLSKGFNMIGAQFKDVGAASDSKAVTTLGSMDGSFAGFDGDFNFANTMMVWDNAADGYTTYGWAGNAPSSLDPDYAEMDNTWLSFSAEPTEDALGVGSGAWIVTDTAGDVVLCGEVSGNSSKAITLAAGFNMVAYPWPASVPVSSFCVLDSSFAGFDGDFNFANTMMVWDNAADGYTTYGWAGNAPSSLDPDYAEMDNTWLSFSAEPTEDVIPAGAGVWIITANAGTATFTPPASAQN